MSETWVIERTVDGRGWRLANDADHVALVHEIFSSKRAALEFAARRAAGLHLRIRESVIADDRVLLDVEPSR